jgi:hypothetical protein
VGVDATLEAASRVRAYLPALLDDARKGRIDPGKVVEAIKPLVRVGTV